MAKKVLGQRGLYSGLLSGVGYIYLPNDIDDREKFISNCHNTGTVSFVTSEGQRYDNVQVSKTIFQDIDFPLNIGDLGSLIFWIKVEKHNKPIILGVLLKRGEIIGFQQYQFLVNKQTNSGVIRISGDGRKGNLFIKLDGTDGILNLSTKKLKALIKEYVNIEVDSFIVKCLKSFSILIKNDLNSDDEKVFSIDENGFKYSHGDNILEIDNDGKFTFENSQYSLKTLFEDLISEIEAIKIATSIGLQPPSNLVNFTQIREEKLNKIFK